MLLGVEAAQHIRQIPDAVGLQVDFPVFIPEFLQGGAQPLNLPVNVLRIIGFQIQLQGFAGLLQQLLDGG